MMAGGVERPVSLHPPQRIGGRFHRGRGHLHRGGPGLKRPGRRGRRVRAEREAAMPGHDAVAGPLQFLGEIRLEASRGEVGRADHRRNAERLSNAQPSMSNVPPSGATGPNERPASALA